PTTSPANCTWRPSFSPNAVATGFSENFGPGLPSGRPRCAATTTLAPASASAFSVGTDATMRPGSVICPSSSSGTLRSERTRTPRPETPSARRSSRVLIAISLQRLADQRDQVDEAVAVTPLVVVPRDDLGLVVDHLGQTGVEDRAVRVGDDVAGDDRRVVVLEDALHPALGGRLERSVDVFDAGRLAQIGGQVGDRAGGNRHPQRVAVELALQLGQHQTDRLRGARRRRHDVQCGGTGPAQVLVRAVLQVLVLRVGVDRGHQALDDAELVVQDFGKWPKAIRGARSIADDVLAAVVLVIVHTENDRDVLVGGGRGDDDLLCAGLQMALRLVGLGEYAGGFDDDVDAEVAPREGGRPFLDFEGLDLVGADDDGVVTFEADVLGQAAEDRVELEQMGQRRVIGEVVDGDHLDVGATALRLLRFQCPVEIASDAAEAVDAHPDCHLFLPRPPCSAVVVYGQPNGDRSG